MSQNEQGAPCCVVSPSIYIMDCGLIIFMTSGEIMVVGRPYIYMGFANTLISESKTLPPTGLVKL